MDKPHDRELNNLAREAARVLSMYGYCKPTKEWEDLAWLFIRSGPV